MSERGTSDEATTPADRPVWDAARDYAYDRYLSALLAPRAAQPDLVVLAAFFGEIRRIPLIVADAAAAEIRLQWWRDALGPHAPASGHPVADAMLELKSRRGLPDDLVLLPLVEGYSRELYEDGIATAADLSRYADETEGVAIRLALQVLGANERDYDTLIEPAGRALALAHLALSLPQQLALGRLPLPPEYIDGRDPRALGPQEARDATRHCLMKLGDEAAAALKRFQIQQTRLPRGFSAAFLPLCLVAPYFKSMLKANRDVLTDVADISPLSRVTRLWFAHWRGRI
jgi:phytoene synthase